MNLKKQGIVITLGFICCLFFSIFSAEAAAVVESIQYKVDESANGKVRVIIQGKNLQEMVKDESLKLVETKTLEAGEEGKSDQPLSFSEQILLSQEKKEQASKPTVGAKTSLREFSFENAKMNKKALVAAPVVLNVQGKDRFSLQIPNHEVGRWGESLQAEFLPADKKAGRKLDQMEYVFTPNCRPSFTPSHKESLKGKVIILDPGHGGKDAGAVGINGTKEKDVNLAIALQVRDELKKWGASPVMTREVDTYAMDDLGDRVQWGLQNKGDIFVSLHSDAALNRAAKGFTVYYYGQKDLSLAKATEKSLKEFMQTQDRGARSANFFVMKRNSLPAILIEMGFISNPEEEKNLMNPDYQRDMVEGTVQGLAEYFYKGSGT